MQPSIIEQNGFSWVSQPREGLKPLTLLVELREGFFARIKNAILGLPATVDIMGDDIFSLFPKAGGGNFPEISKPQKTAFFSGHDILNTTAQFNLSGLKGLPQIGEAKMEAKINKATKRLFSFKDVRYLQVDTEVLLEEHLNLHKPTIEAPGFIEKLQSGKIYVILDVLQAKEFSVKDASDFELTGGVTVAAIEEYLADLNASAERSHDQQDKLSHKGSTYLTFAVKAAKIQYRGDYSISREPLRKVRSVSPLDEEGLATNIISIE